MDNSLFYIIGIVAFVGVIGLWTVSSHEPSYGGVEIASDGISGNVVLDQSDPVSTCDDCVGSPVCAAKAQRAMNYPSACAAQCDGARILFDDYCEKIPRVAGD